jgi:hypothetical protein
MGSMPGHTEYRLSNFSVPLFLAQQLAVPGLSLLFAGIVSAFLQSHSSILNVIADYLTFCLYGFYVGYTWQRHMPGVRCSGGRWIWIAPACLLMWGFLSELTIEPTRLIASVFTGDGPEAGYIMLFVTLPTVACCAYSLGVIARSRRDS